MIAALFTRMSMPPKASTAARAMRLRRLDVDHVDGHPDGVCRRRP